MYCSPQTSARRPKADRARRCELRAVPAAETGSGAASPCRSGNGRARPRGFCSDGRADHDGQADRSSATSRTVRSSRRKDSRSSAERRATKPVRKRCRPNRVGRGLSRGPVSRSRKFSGSHRSMPSRHEFFCKRHFIFPSRSANGWKGVGECAVWRGPHSRETGSRKTLRAREGRRFRSGSDERPAAPYESVTDQRPAAPCGETALWSISDTTSSAVWRSPGRQGPSRRRAQHRNGVARIDGA